ncbi:MAG: PEGA domain-containing protein [Gammaproteobacteria bacterium]|nr:PEGA domain-containing protein [Gammaproteobacteria bacterium]
MNRFAIAFFGGLALVLGVAGCATIVSGSSESITFNSSPEGATVYIDGTAVGTTPTTIEVDRSGNEVLRFEKEGYKPYETRLEKTVNGWFFGNVIIGGLIGSSTDISSGAMHQYAQKKYMVALEPISSNGLNGVTSRPKTERVREFIVTGYVALLKDIENGEGSHLESLLGMLEVEQENRQQAVERLRDLANTYDEIPLFADAVVEAFSQQ